VQGKPVWVALRGRDWNFSDDSLLSMLQRTVALQRAFWDDFEVPYYTVVLTPLAPRPVVSYGQVSATTTLYLGTSLTNSFTAFVTPHRHLDIEDLSHLFHHELMHHWIGCHIRNGGQPHDMQMAWFSEGFTEYFALKNQLKGGFLTEEQYMGRLNSDFFDVLHHSPKRSASNQEISGCFFTDPECRQIPYARGCVFAFFLDNAFKAGSRGQTSLHRLMLDMLEYYQRSDRDLLHNFDFFLQHCSDYLQKDALPAYEKYILKGQLISAEDFLLPPYLKMEVNENGMPFFWLDKSVDGWERGIRE
jgi:predicted metalloprotease with PDZ domain